MVAFIVTMERRPGFYITYLYLPCVVIIATSLFAFYLPPGSDSKIDLAVTGLLSQTVFLLLISDLLPPDANDPPFLGMFRTHDAYSAAQCSAVQCSAVQCNTAQRMVLQYLTLLST